LYLQRLFQTNIAKYFNYFDYLSTNLFMSGSNK